MGITELKLIPTPKDVIGSDDDGNFTSTKVPAKIYTAKKEWQKAVDSFCKYAKKAHAIDFMKATGGIELRCDSGMMPAHYKIDSTSGIIVYASEISGVTAALATLLQIVAKDESDVSIPKIILTDYPDCGYRSLMVDLARQWHPFYELFDYIDLCFLYKVNYLQLHFIDTESYTLPSDVFPKLPTVGRHYTKAQMKRLVNYAAYRHVTLIPEFESPGHSAAMIKAYPEFFNNTDNRHDDNIICAGKPGVYDTIDCIIGEICEMFPNSPYIHIGGDEASIKDWESCDDCRKYMSENSIPSVMALYTHFVANVTQIVFKHGRTPIVWEGFPKEGMEEISRDVVVIAWESYYHLAPDLVEEGLNIINASWQPLYIVPDNQCPVKQWTPYDILSWNIYNWQHSWKNSAAHLNPIHTKNIF